MSVGKGGITVRGRSNILYEAVGVPWMRKNRANEMERVKVMDGEAILARIRLQLSRME
jgi:hypothetical protein